jgi:hypothetical protein
MEMFPQEHFLHFRPTRGNSGEFSRSPFSKIDVLLVSRFWERRSLHVSTPTSAETRNFADSSVVHRFSRGRTRRFWFMICLKLSDFSSRRDVCQGDEQSGNCWGHSPTEQGRALSSRSFLPIPG